MPSSSARRFRQTARSASHSTYIYRPLLIASPLALTYYFLPAPEPPNQHALISLLILASPLLLLALLALLSLLSFLAVLAYAHARLVLAVWTPLGVLALVWLWVFAPGKGGGEGGDGDPCRLWGAGLIVAAPFVALYAYIVGLWFWFLALLAVVGAQYLFYGALLWKWVLVRPRFRGEDKFAATDLCDWCRGMLGASGLLFGRWWLFTRSEESYTYGSGERSLDDRGARPLCHLCFLMARPSQAFRAKRSVVRDGVVAGYGSIAPPTGGAGSELERGGALVVKLNTGWWGLNPDDFWRSRPDCSLQVCEADGQSSRAMEIAAGPLDLKSKLHGSTDSPEIFATIKRWLSACSSHQACQTAMNADFIPTRLISVGNDEDPRCHLVERTELAGQQIQYFALSHCWGKDVEVVLTTSTLSSMKSDINVASLSKNFRDAIAITRALGMSYLWIDSLCIIQGSAEDWTTESVLMMDVFANASCTISATASPSSQGGCFRSRLDDSAPCLLAAAASSSTGLHVYPRGTHETLKTLFDTRVDAAPLARRAWAFQERLLSRRIVHFCEDIVLFECNKMQASERDVRGSGYEKSPYVVIKGRMHGTPSFRERMDAARRMAMRGTSVTQNVGTRVDVEPAAGEGSGLSERDKLEIANGNFEDHTATRGIRGALDTLLSIDAGGSCSSDDQLTLWEKLEFNRRWYELVTPYSRGRLTRLTDRPVAIAGVAALVADKSRAAYVAGLWANIAIEFGLLWRVVGSGTRQAAYCAPSWSWTCVDGHIELLPSVPRDAADVTFYAAVREAVVTLGGKPVEGAVAHVDGGYLDITGPALKTTRSKIDPAELIIEGFGPGLSGKIEWFPDSRASVAAGAGSNEWISLVVLSTKVPYEKDLVTLQGLVLRDATKGAEEGTTPQFERIGVFRADSCPIGHIQILSEMWQHRKLRVI